MSSRLDDQAEPDPAAARVAFAGLLLLLIGILSVIQGIAALADSSALVDSPDLIAFGSTTWGTTLVLLGLACDAMAVSLWIGAAVRWIGVFLAAVNGVVQLLFMPAYPFWSLAVFALDVVAIMALFKLGAYVRDGSPDQAAAAAPRQPTTSVKGSP